jgi:hypothetical protein
VANGYGCAATMMKGGGNTVSTTGTAKKQVVGSCSFCTGTNAAIVITGQLLDKPLCLLHYYTTRAARSFPVNRVTPIGDGTELQLQLPLVESLFSEAFVELKHEISEGVAKQSLYHPSSLDPLSILWKKGKTGSSASGTRIRRASSSQEAWQPLAPDPLSILYSSSFSARTVKHASGKKSTMQRKVAVKPTPAATEGGFIRQIKIPERLHHNLKSASAELNTDFSGADETTLDASLPYSEAPCNPYKRRKKSNLTYWSIPTTSGLIEQQATRKQVQKNWMEEIVQPKDKCLSCGSSEVKLDFSVNGRNDEMAKGEIWGKKDRSDVMHSYRCLHCGKMWSDEG